MILYQTIILFLDFCPVIRPRITILADPGGIAV
jgi:hypothetical protein